MLFGMFIPFIKTSDNILKNFFIDKYLCNLLYLYKVSEVE